MRHAPRDIDGVDAGQPARVLAIDLHRSNPMLRLVFACVALCFGAGAAVADTGMLPNGAVITWDRPRNGRR